MGQMEHSLHEPHAEEELVGGGAAMVDVRARAQINDFYRP